jgi:hypothetical protein
MRKCVRIETQKKKQNEAVVFIGQEADRAGRRAVYPWPHGKGFLDHPFPIALSEN